MSSVLDRVCPRCGHDGRVGTLFEDPHTIHDERPPYGREVRCGGCRLFLGFLPRLPGPNGRRRDLNAYHRALWLERHGGDLRCAICGARRSERERVAFDIDHLVALEDGGPDEDWNTAPLCRDCHVIKNAIRALRRHAEGLSARDRAA